MKAWSDHRKKGNKQDEPYNCPDLLIWEAAAQGGETKWVVSRIPELRRRSWESENKAGRVHGTDYWRGWRRNEKPGDPQWAYSGIQQNTWSAHAGEEATGTGEKTGWKDDREQFLLFVYGQEECLFPPATPEKVIIHGAPGRALLVGSH